MFWTSLKAFSLSTSVGFSWVCFWIRPLIRNLPKQVSTQSIKVALLSRLGSCAQLAMSTSNPTSTEGIFSALRRSHVIHVWLEMSMGTGTRSPFIRCREAPVMSLVSVGYGVVRTSQLWYPSPLQALLRNLPSLVHPS